VPVVMDPPTPPIQLRILIVDDEPLVSRVMAKILRNDGHIVETVLGTPEALAKYEPGKFDLIITAFIMPVMNGDEFAAIIKSRSQQQPVVMFSAYGDTLRTPEHPMASVDYIGPKPLSAEILREVIDRFSLGARECHRGDA